MRIVFTGGVTGGHFYPIIAVTQALRDIIKEEKILDPKLYFLAPSPYNKGLLYNNEITFKKVSAGKLRRNKGTGFRNFIDLFITGFGLIKALWTMFWIYPDVVFSKGGHGSFPVVLAARILRIPVIIHESDSAPGKVNAWAGKFARKIAVSYAEAAKHFPEDKVAWTGNPIRKEIVNKAFEGGYEFLDLDSTAKTILVLGGSQGAVKINNAILDILPDLLEKYQVVHQTGVKNIEEVRKMAAFVAEDERMQARYKPFPYLDDVAMRMSAGVADLVVTRSGSTLFEVANWNIPAIAIPIPEEISHDQRKNAYAYARSGAGIVIEESNLTPTLLKQEIERVLETEDIYKSLIEGTKKFTKENSADAIAKVIMEQVILHEQ